MNVTVPLKIHTLVIVILPLVLQWQYKPLLTMQSYTKSLRVGFSERGDKETPYSSQPIYLSGNYLTEML